MSACSDSFSAINNRLWWPGVLFWGNSMCPNLSRAWSYHTFGLGYNFLDGISNEWMNEWMNILMSVWMTYMSSLEINGAFLENDHTCSKGNESIRFDRIGYATHDEKPFKHRREQSINEWMLGTLYENVNCSETLDKFFNIVSCLTDWCISMAGKFERYNPKIQWKNNDWQVIDNTKEYRWRNEWDINVRLNLILLINHQEI